MLQADNTLDKKSYTSKIKLDNAQVRDTSIRMAHHDRNQQSPAENQVDFTLEHLILALLVLQTIVQYVLQLLAAVLLL